MNSLMERSLLKPFSWGQEAQTLEEVCKTEKHLDPTLIFVNRGPRILLYDRQWMAPDNESIPNLRMGVCRRLEFHIGVQPPIL